MLQKDVAEPLSAPWTEWVNRSKGECGVQRQTGHQTAQEPHGAQKGLPPRIYANLFRVTIFSLKNQKTAFSVAMLKGCPSVFHGAHTSLTST